MMEQEENGEHHLKQSTSYGGGSVMALDCVAANGTGSLVPIDHRLLIEAAELNFLFRFSQS